MKTPVKLSAFSLILLIVACTATYAGPKRPWRVEVTTSGGFAGHGTGDYAIDSAGQVTAKLFNGRQCTFTAAAEDVDRIEELLARARPREWKDSYEPKETCCDRFAYTLTYDEAGTVTETRWIDHPLPMPKDLAALADAIVGGGDNSIRMLATRRCAKK
jgi:hypothetical protein